MNETVAIFSGIGAALAIPVAGYSLAGGGGLALGLFLGPLAGYGLVLVLSPKKQPLSPRY